jgi:hypothetical protein
MRSVMRSVLVAVSAVLLAFPASAGAYSLDYEAPDTSVSKGDPLTFAVRTTAPEGSVTIRVSGSDEVDGDGLLSGPDGTWLDEHPKQALSDLQVWSVPSASVLRRRPGHYYWQAYVTGDAAEGAEEPIGPVQGLDVTLPAADKGRGSLSPRFGKTGRTSFYLSSKRFPAGVSGKRFQTVIKTAATRWGLKALRWTSVKAGVKDGFNVAGFSSDVPSGTLGVQTDFMKHGRIVESDLALRTGENWNPGPNYPALDEIDLESVLLHELGHMAGNKKHTARCANSPMDDALGAGEWWRGARDKWFGDCTSGATASSAGRLVHRVVSID